MHARVRVKMVSLICLVLLGITGFAQTADAVRFVINTPVAGRSRAVEMLVKRLSEESNGRITGQIIESGAMGNEREVAEAIQMGSLDISTIANPQIGNVIDDLYWLSFPGLFYNYDEVMEMVFHGWIGEEMTKACAANQIIRLATLDNGFRSTGSVARELDAPAAYKGLKVRTAANEPHVKFYEFLGALPMTVVESEVATALQQKTVDAVDNNVYNYVGQGVDQLVRYVTDVPLYATASIIASQMFWDGLSEEDQALFLQVAKEVEEWYLEYFRNVVGDLKQNNSQKGLWTLTEITPELQTAFAQASEQVWNYYEQTNPDRYKDIIARLREMRAMLDAR